MELQLVSKEVAILAEELGFDWECRNILLVDGSTEYLNYYENGGKATNTLIIEKDGYFSTSYDNIECTLPEQELLAKWLRDNHNLDSIPIVKYVESVCGNDLIKVYKTGFSEDSSEYKIYEDCLEHILLLGLEHLRSIKKSTK